MTLEHKIKTNFVGKALSFFRRHIGIAALGIGMSILAYSCIEEQQGCQYDSQCSAGRICVDSECVDNPNYVNPNNINNYDDIQESYADTQSGANNPCENNVYFLDADKDGFGSKNTWICEPADGFVSNDADCDDNDPNIGGPITCTYDGTGCGTFNLCANTCPLTPSEDPCNNKDDNCNGQIDENKVIEYQQGCSNGKVHWQDECGNVGATIETCIGTTNCSKTCVGTDVHWMNECGGIEAKVETCTGSSQCATTCVNNDVYLQNECGGIEAKVETCNVKTEACIDGACECQPNCQYRKCGDDSCGGSCGECNTGYECHENNNNFNSSYCECTDCGGLCCFEDGKECVEYFDEYQQKSYRCIPPGMNVCDSLVFNGYDLVIGYCPPNKVCSFDGNCCPIEKPYFLQWCGWNGSIKCEKCCDTKYPQPWESGQLPSDSEINNHCVNATDMG
jgi:hypothetical protein